MVVVEVSKKFESHKVQYTLSTVWATWVSDHVASHANIQDAVLMYRSKVLITASGGLRGPKKVELKQIADAACSSAAKEGFQVWLCLSLPDGNSQRMACCGPVKAT